MIMQTAFFKLANVIAVDDALAYLKDQIQKLFAKKSQKIVDMNFAAVDKTLENLVEIKYPASWVESEGREKAEKDEPDFVKNVMRPMLVQQGDKLPVSAFTPDGIFPVMQGLQQNA